MLFCQHRFAAYGPQVNRIKCHISKAKHNNGRPLLCKHCHRRSRDSTLLKHKTTHEAVPSRKHDENALSHFKPCLASQPAARKRLDRKIKVSAPALLRFGPAAASACQNLHKVKATVTKRERRPGETRTLRAQVQKAACQNCGQACLATFAILGE